MKPLILLVVVMAVSLNHAVGAAVQDREGAVRNDKAAMEKDSRWIYNDWQSGLAEGRKTGKPVMIVLRCVPCLSCMGIDAQVLLQEDDIKPLMEKFVCVRVINANALDLSLFNFDYDLSFTTMFFNGDGTLYGRYGSWTHQKNAQDKTTAGFKRALEGALELHRGYPANKGALAGKQSPKSTYKTPVDIPTLSGKYKVDLDWNGKVVPSCIHCHQIGDALRANWRKTGEAMPGDMIYPWPGPETIGVGLAGDHRARIESVTPKSVAANAGLKPEDEIMALEGQPLLSAADLSWVLHRAPDTGTLSALIRRDGREQTVRIDLPSAWRSKTDISRRTGTWNFRGMAAGGLSLEDLPDAERTRRGLDSTQLALLVKHVGEYGKHAAAKKAGFRKDDVIIELEDVTGRLSESELLGQFLVKTKAGDKKEATVLRGTERLKLVLPIQ